MSQLLTLCANAMSAPKPPPVYITRQFVLEVNQQIANATAEKPENYDAVIPSGLKPYTLLQILGPERDGHWWRLYIDPKDWDDALKIEDPGFLYDGQTSKGWQKNLITVYERFLGAKSEDYLLESRMTWQKYQEM